MTLGPDGLPLEVTVRDASGNRNQFTFNGWRPDREPPLAFFQPSLPGLQPLRPGRVMTRSRVAATMVAAAASGRRTKP